MGEELSGIELDAAVARAVGFPVDEECDGFNLELARNAAGEYVGPVVKTPESAHLCYSWCPRESREQLGMVLDWLPKTAGVKWHWSDKRNQWCACVYRLGSLTDGAHYGWGITRAEAICSAIVKWGAAKH